MILTINRAIILENSDIPEYVEAEISDLSFIMLNINSDNPKEILIKFDVKEENRSVLEIVIRSDTKIFKIIKKLAKIYEYLTGNKVKIYESILDDFLSEKTLEYINLCYYDEIKTIKSFKRNEENYKISDFVKLDLLGEGSNGKVIII